MAKKKVKSKPKVANKPSDTETTAVSSNATNNELVSTAVNAAAQSVFLKLCRLCESKDGPFLNIFEADKIIAKKIEELMPFGIAENDDLPHKICFRCSAKVEELHEFIQKCIKTQENLRQALGKTGPLNHKTKTRTAWEEKLVKTNLSNDDICDALIKKAMEGIKNIPLKPSPTEEAKDLNTKRVTRNNAESPVPKRDLRSAVPKETVATSPPEIDEDDLPIKRPSRSSKVEATNSDKKVEITNEQQKTVEVKANPTTLQSFSMDYEEPIINKSNQTVPKTQLEEPENPAPAKEKVQKAANKKPVKKKVEKPFNIMDHVSMIKVTGVGILFQCKLCNRNFVKKEVVESHNCAKNGIPKNTIDFAKSVQAPVEPCKAPTVKYIKMDTNVKKALVENEPKSAENKSPLIVNNKTVVEAPVAPPKPKPRIGPASKTKNLTNQPQTELPKPIATNPTNATPSFVLPAMPSVNGRYKLVPGPNNTFTLFEDSPVPPLNTPQQETPETKKVSKKRKPATPTISPHEVKIARQVPEVAAPQDNTQPYPVGLFQTVAHHSRLYEPSATVIEPTAFMTPAVKKQSYTVVQTGNPSKLLISTKPQSSEDAPSKKNAKQKKSKPAAAPVVDKEPYRVTLEDTAPPKDTGFFTFINVDPLLQPSYVLPTDSIIQESQISTSTSATNKVDDPNKYSCNMCGEHFSREKKLLAHIQSHYTQMDEEDLKRAEKGKKKHKK